MKYNRWKTSFRAGAFLAVCKLCNRVTDRKGDLAVCPRKCEIEEQRIKGEETKARKAHFSQEALPF